MDVRAWLQNTADREPPDERDKAGSPEHLRPERYTAEAHTHVQQGKRKRASSESVLARRRPSRGRHGGHGRERAAPDDSSSHRVRSAHDGTASSRSSCSVSRRESSPDRRFNTTFERRARHKTKEDCHEPTTKKRRKKHESREDHKFKSKSMPRKSHRRGDGVRTAGLVTNFQLKDRPKNHRLTLRPADASAGIFKHGRAGAPITGKGSGLPDLVFNEMRFLQRPREHQDEIHRDHPEKARSERTDKQQEGNISTHFAKQHTEGAQQPEQQGLVAVLDQHCELRPQENREAAASQQRRGGPIVEAAGVLPDNAFLGFGSRGSNQDLKNANRRSNTCYTWSESVPAPKSSMPEPFVRTIMPVAHSAILPTEQEKVDRPHRTRRHLDERQEGLAKRPRTQGSKGRWVHSKRPQGSASVVVFQPTVNAEGSHREHVVPTRIRSSLSVPRSGQDLPPTHARAFNSQLVPGSCPTSDILRIRDEFRDCGDQSPVYQHNVPCGRSREREKQGPSTSTPTSETLRHAFHAISRAQTGNTPHCNDGSEDVERSSTARPGKDTTQYHSGAAAEYSQLYGRFSEQHALEMPQRGFSRSTDVSHARQQQPVARPSTRAVSFLGNPRVLSRPSFAMAQNQAVSPDDEMLDKVTGYRPVLRAQQYTFTNSRQADDLARRSILNQQQEPVAPQRIDPAYLHTPSEGQGDHRGRIDEIEGADFLRTESKITGTSTGPPYSVRWSNIDAPARVPDPGGGEVQRERMPAFWKPNKLY